MSSIPSALPVRAEQDLTWTLDDRRWRVRGLERALSRQRLKVNVLVERKELVHVDTLDLYAARSRRAFIKEAAAELYVEEELIKKDLGRVLLEVELRQEKLLQENFAKDQNKPPPMSESQRHEALEMLRDPALTSRILSDYDELGVVGEETNKLACYLACVSRLLPRPLAVLVQSSSAAGKTSLVEATLSLMPPEAQLRLSALTGQSLYYMGPAELKHKILAVAETEGMQEASYALKLLQSEGRLSIAVAGKERDTLRQRTERYEVEGPVAMLLTTTADEPDEELASRCITLSVNEEPGQTAAIHQRQRAAYASGNSGADAHTVKARHANAQRLLEPLTVVIPWAERLSFRTDELAARRDHAKYLALIAASALLHQHQRKRLNRTVAAALEDLELANRLASERLASGADTLLPQTQRLLSELERYVAQKAKHERVQPAEVRFTQRELREHLRWHDRALRRQLTRLVELEYVAVYRTGRGNQRVYQLLYRSRDVDGPLRLGLTDPEALRPKRNSRKTQASHSA